MRYNTAMAPLTPRDIYAEEFSRDRAGRAVELIHGGRITLGAKLEGEDYQLSVGKQRPYLVVGHFAPIGLDRVTRIESLAEGLVRVLFSDRAYACARDGANAGTACTCAHSYPCPHRLTALYLAGAAYPGGEPPESTWGERARAQQLMDEMSAYFLARADVTALLRVADAGYVRFREADSIDPEDPQCAELIALPKGRITPQSIRTILGRR